MRITFVTHRYSAWIGGTESFLHGLSHELAQRHEVMVLAHRIDPGPSDRLTDSLRPPPTFEPFLDGGVRVKPLRFSRLRSAALAPLVFQVVPGLRRYAYGPIRRPAASLYAHVVGPVIANEARRAEVIHVLSGGFLGAAAVRAAQLCGAPAVVTAFIHRHQWGDDPTSAAVYRSADRVVALLEVEAQIYRELGVAPERICVCGLGVTAVNARGGGELRRSHGIEGPLVLFLGARREYKGADVLLAAAREIGKHVPNVTLAFVGPGDPLVVESSMPRVLEIPPVGEDGRAAWLDAADVLCLPSAAESFGLVVVEAWSVRKPVVVSDIPTLRELVGDAEGGIVAAREAPAVAEAVVRLLTDPATAARLGDRGYRRWADRYTIEYVARRHESMYESLTKAQGSAIGRPAWRHSTRLR